ncbi:MAG: PH domain-containing protein [Ruminococcus sp.]|nr:PH domain-containing protein [Ruminococcus sp.]
MKKYKPDRKGLLTIRIVSAAASIILAVAAKMYITIEFLFFIVIIFIITTAIFIMFVYFPLYISSLSYETTSTEVIKHSGVLVRTHQSVRFDSIQYTAVINTPLSQYTGFNFIVFFVYGGQLRLDFLSRQDTVEILKTTRTNSMREI